MLVYTGEERFWKEYEGNKNYEPTTFNTEHIYPRSKIVTEAVTDLHHLRVCDKKVNTRRSNHPFTEGKGAANLHNKAWYPGDEWKGDVARMIFYLNLRYNEEINEEDPVSDFEHQRNNVIEGAQGNRNPFIDFPQLARTVFQH